MLRKETFDHVGTDIETYEMFQFELIAGVEWRISTKSKSTIAAKQSSTPGIAALDMITRDVVWWDGRTVGERKKSAVL